MPVTVVPQKVVIKIRREISTTNNSGFCNRSLPCDFCRWARPAPTSLQCLCYGVLWRFFRIELDSCDWRLPSSQCPQTLPRRWGKHSPYEPSTTKWSIGRLLDLWYPCPIREFFSRNRTRSQHSIHLLYRRWLWRLATSIPLAQLSCTWAAGGLLGYVINSFVFDNLSLSLVITRL